MISGPTSGFQHDTQMFGRAMENVATSSNSTSLVSGPSEVHSNALIYNLSILKEKVQQVQSLVNIVAMPDHHRGPQDSVSIAVASMGTLIQEIIVTASSMMYTCQKIALDTGAQDGGDGELHHQQQDIIGDSTQHNHAIGESGDVGYFRNETFDNHYINNDDDDSKTNGLRDYSSINCEVIELNVADLLAKYTHYCQICGKGFKRDANLRMHMRAHGDQYKSNAALSNPMKAGYSDESMISSPRKYSCPQEGCRWNKNHAKFQPLKSVICVKNHYKRSHCPKMYVCNRCNQKQFSLLSDLRTHEKHCGDLKWQCTCGTTFSRKDKLMGHVSLFIGHAPAVNCFTDSAKYDRS